MNFYAYAIPDRAASRWLAAAGRGTGHRQLRVNVRDEGEAFVLSAPVPGLRAEDVKIQVLEDVVQIEGEYPADGDEYLLREVPAGGFRREVRLPSPLDADGVQAGIANGMLTLRLPKAEASRPRKIKVGAN